METGAPNRPEERSRIPSHHHRHLQLLRTRRSSDCSEHSSAQIQKEETGGEISAHE